MKLVTSFLLALAITQTALAEKTLHPDLDTRGWAPSGAQVLKDKQGTAFVRLELRKDAACVQLTNSPVFEAERDYELSVEFKSNNKQSTRDRGSWVFIAFRDDKNQGTGEQTAFFETTDVWKIKTLAFKTPLGTTQAYVSFRQQQAVGVFDIRNITLKSSNAAKPPQIDFSQNVVKALHWLCTPGEKLSPDGIRPPAQGNIFQPFLGKVPTIVKELGTETVKDGVTVRKVVFRSLIVEGEPQDVYAVIARPPGDGPFPAIVWLHGGHGCAQIPTVTWFAQCGYVAISPDLPGIADPKNCPNSTGPWQERWGKQGAYPLRPNVTANPYFDAIVSGLQAFNLVGIQPGVNKERIGLTGISMGAYSTTVITGLLGKRVRAAWALYGCGHFELGSEWSGSLAELPDDEREIWLRNFDGGRQAPKIQSPFFIAAAVRDHFFWPPAVNATLREVPAGSNHLYAPAESHSLKGIPEVSRGWDILYFNYWLKGEGQPYPEVLIDSCAAQPDGGRLVTFSVKAPLPVKEANLFVSSDKSKWEDRMWESIPAEATDSSHYKAVIPADKAGKQGAWYVSVSDTRPATASSMVYDMDATGTASALLPVGVTVKVK